MKDNMTSSRRRISKTPDQQPKKQKKTPSPKGQERRSRKHDDETKKMKKLFAVFTANTKKN
jgi:hypothetical protein